MTDDPTEILSLEDLIDLEETQKLINDFYQMNNRAVAVVSLEGRALLSSHWQPICRKFHRVHPITCAKCVESDTHIKFEVEKDRRKIYKYQCDNGLYDAAAPIIINGQHLANLFIGQFLLEPPDVERFKAQAKKYGFPEEPYLKALAEVPIITQEELEKQLLFLRSFSEFIANMGLKELRRGQAEKALKISEMKYRSVIENANEGIFILQDVQFKFTNPKFLEITGYSEEEVLNAKFLDYIYPDDRPMMEQNYKDRNAGLIEGDSYQVRILGKSGKIIWVEVKPVVITWDQRPAILVLLSDITERILAEEARRRADERFKLVSDQSQLGIIVFQEGRYKYINQAAVDMCGYSLEEVMTWEGDDFFKVIHLDDRDRFITQNSQASISSDQESDSRFIFKGITKTGETRWFEQFVKTIHFEEKPAFLFTLVDVTDRIVAEMALKENEEKYRTVVENSVEGIYVLQNGCFQLTNPEMEQIMGYSAAELYKLNAFDLVHPEDRQRIRSVVEDRDFDPNQAGFETYRVVDKSGAIHWVESKAVVISWNNQPAYLVFLTDISDRRRSEEVMIQSEKLISLGGLAAGMAHEINNPLGAMIQSAQVISRRFAPGQEANEQVARKYDINLENIQKYMEERKIAYSLNGILESGKKAASIVLNMLQFSRKSDPESIISISLTQLIDRTLEMAGKDYNLKKRYDFRSIVIDKAYDEAMPNVPCNENEIEQVLLNLFKNAAQAMNDTNPDVVRRMSIRVSQEVKMARIEISDTGPGIPDDIKNRIFEPFFTTKPPGEGTGLGLSVSYSIISKNHQGTMEVESGAAGGTTFIIRLPLQQSTDQ